MATCGWSPAGSPGDGGGPTGKMVETVPAEGVGAGERVGMLTDYVGAFVLDASRALILLFDGTLKFGDARSA